MAGRAPEGAQGGPTEAQLREVVLRGETLRQNLAALEQQRELVHELLTDARNALTALEHLEGAKEGDELLVPLGAGAFVHARLASQGTALSNLGAGVHAEVPTTAARERMTERVKSLGETNDALARDILRVGDELQRINAVLEQVYGGA